MARKNHIKHYKMLDNVSIATNQTSDKTNVEPVDQGTIQVEWTGTSPVGVLTLEASNSSDIEFTQGTENWVELDFGVPIAISGASGNHQIIFDSLPFRYVRIIYTSTSGTGNLTANFHATSIGA